jgi:hypothetical protein
MEVFKIRHVCFSAQTTGLFALFMSQAKSRHLLRVDCVLPNVWTKPGQYRIPKLFSGHGILTIVPPSEHQYSLDTIEDIAERESSDVSRCILGLKYLTTDCIACTVGNEEYRRCDRSFRPTSNVERENCPNEQSW